METGYESIISLDNIIVQVPVKGEKGKYRTVTWKEFIKLCKNDNEK